MHLIIAFLAYIADIHTHIHKRGLSRRKVYICESKVIVVKRIILILSIFLFPLAGFSQYYWDYGLKLGASNYLGDIGGLSQSKRPFVLDMKMQETRWAVGGYVRYKLRDPWSLEAQL